MWEVKADLFRLAPEKIRMEGLRLHRLFYKLKRSYGDSLFDVQECRTKTCHLVLHQLKSSQG